MTPASSSYNKHTLLFLWHSTWFCPVNGVHHEKTLSDELQNKQFIFSPLDSEISNRMPKKIVMSVLKYTAINASSKIL